MLYYSFSLVNFQIFSEIMSCTSAALNILLSRFASLQKAYRSHVARLLNKINEINKDGTVLTVEESHFATLATSIKQLMSKYST